MAALVKPPSLCLRHGSGHNKHTRSVPLRHGFRRLDAEVLKRLSVSALSSDTQQSKKPSDDFAVDSLDSLNIYDFQAESSTESSKVNLPPRICSLREFGKSGEGMVAVDTTDTAVSSFFRSLAANIELSAKVQDWEILSGRLAMMVFASAVLVEAFTGNSVFQKLDRQRLLEFGAAAAVSSLVAAGFALALQAKTRVAYTVTKGYKSLINGLIDSLIDGLLFDDESP